MGILLGIAISFCSIFLIVLLRSVTTLFHELGHAIPALLFSEGRVIVYIGSYGDTSKSLELHVGKLSIYFKINLFDWKIGMCSHQGIPNIWKNMLVIIGGPVASLLIAIPLVYIAATQFLALHWILLIGIFAMSATIDFVFNIFPIAKPIQMHDGGVSYNDGYQVVELAKRMALSEEYLKAEKLMEQKKYLEVIEFAIKKLQVKLDKNLFLLKIEAHLKLEQRHEALLAYDEYIKDFTLQYEDYLRLGMIYKELGNREEAMNYFNHCFHVRFDDPDLLNAIGEICFLQANYELAIKRLTGAIMYSEDFYAPYIHRAKAFIKLKRYDMAMNDLERTLEFDPYHFEAHYQLGILFERQGNYEQSFIAFQKAHEIKPKHPGLAFKIELIREHVV